MGRLRRLENVPLGPCGAEGTCRARSRAELQECGARCGARWAAGSSVWKVRELVVPTVALEAAWREAHVEWGPGAHEDGFGLEPSDDVTSAEGFAEWVTRLVQAGELHHGPRCTYRWIVEDGNVLGGIAVGHQLDEFRLHARGQVGYGLRPSARGRGLGSWALKQMLNEMCDVGLKRVLLVCADDNVPSVKTIERCGGILEDVRLTDLGHARRYWIDLGTG